MGATRLISAVADTGPFIHLAEIGCLSLLNIIDILHVPEAVWLEATEKERVPQDNLMGFGNIQRHNVPHLEVVQFIQENHLGHLHEGERECLFLCKQIGISTLLTDDLSVREAAKNLNIIPAGSLGIVVKNFKVGRISLAEAEFYISNLYDMSSLFVTRAIVELTIEQLRQGKIG